MGCMYLKYYIPNPSNGHTVLLFLLVHMLEKAFVCSGISCTIIASEDLFRDTFSVGGICEIKGTSVVKDKDLLQHHAPSGVSTAAFTPLAFWASVEWKVLLWACNYSVEVIIALRGKEMYREWGTRRERECVSDRDSDSEWVSEWDSLNLGVPVFLKKKVWETWIGCCTFSSMPVQKWHSYVSNRRAVIQIPRGFGGNPVFHAHPAGNEGPQQRTVRTYVTRAALTQPTSLLLS